MVSLGDVCRHDVEEVECAFCSLFPYDRQMVETYKDKFNKKYGFAKGTAHSVADISRITGFKKAGLETIVEKGKGAFFSDRDSVRPTVKSPDQWGKARLYSAVMGGKAAAIDKAQLVKK